MEGAGGRMVRVEVRGRDGAWAVPQWGQPVPLARGVAEVRAEIAKRLWPFMEVRLVPVERDQRAEGR